MRTHPYAIKKEFFSIIFYSLLCIMCMKEMRGLNFEELQKCSQNENVVFQDGILDFMDSTDHVFINSSTLKICSKMLESCSEMGQITEISFS